MPLAVKSLVTKTRTEPLRNFVNAAMRSVYMTPAQGSRLTNDEQATNDRNKPA